MAVSDELIKLAARLVFRQVAAPYRAALKRRIVGAVVCGVLGFVASVAGFVCAVAAFWYWLAPKLGPAVAALVCAAALLLVAIVLGLIAARCARRPPSAALQDVLNSKEIVALLEKHLPELMIAAAIGGLIFGARRRK
jgi:hypothetical protein